VSFAAQLRSLHFEWPTEAPDIEGLAAAALDDPTGVAAAVDEITVSVRDDPDLAFIRLLGLVEVLNEVLRHRKALPEQFAGVIRKLREALAWIATALSASSYQVAYHPTPGGVTISVTFAGDS
jgi:hypothetical protein